MASPTRTSCRTCGGEGREGGKGVQMSNVKMALALAGVAVAAAAAGCAAGLLLAPASGAELRRRMAWRLADEQRALARACERALQRATELARQEIERHKGEMAGSTEA